MLVFLARYEIEQPGKKTCGRFRTRNNEESAVHNDFAKVEIALVLLLYYIIEEVAVITVLFQSFQNLFSAVIKMFFSCFRDTSRNAPLEEALKRAASFAHASSSLFDCTSFDGLTDERNPKAEVLCFLSETRIQTTNCGCGT